MIFLYKPKKHSNKKILNFYVGIGGGRQGKLELIKTGKVFWKSNQTKSHNGYNSPFRRRPLGNPPVGTE
jgi:hypothetical protein